MPAGQQRRRCVFEGHAASAESQLDSQQLISIKNGDRSDAALFEAQFVQFSFASTQTEAFKDIVPRADNLSCLLQVIWRIPEELMMELAGTQSARDFTAIRNICQT